MRVWLRSNNHATYICGTDADIGQSQGLNFMPSSTNSDTHTQRSQKMAISVKFVNCECKTKSDIRCRRDRTERKRKLDMDLYSEYTKSVSKIGDAISILCYVNS